MGKRCIVAWLSLDELNQKIKVERNGRVLKRLYFIRNLLEGDTLTSSCKRVGVVRTVGYHWLERWNEQGYEGLIPRFGGGRPSKLTKEEKGELVLLLDERDDWTLEEIRDLIDEEFNVVYSFSRLRDVLKSLSMKHAKPFMKDYRRPDNADQILKKTSKSL